MDLRFSIRAWFRIRAGVDMHFVEVVRLLCIFFACVLLGMGIMLLLLTAVPHSRELKHGGSGLGCEWVICWVPIAGSVLFAVLGVLL